MFDYDEVFETKSDFFNNPNELKKLLIKDYPFSQQEINVFCNIVSSNFLDKIKTTSKLDVLSLMVLANRLKKRYGINKNIAIYVIKQIHRVFYKKSVMQTCKYQTTKNILRFISDDYKINIVTLGSTGSMVEYEKIEFTTSSADFYNPPVIILCNDANKLAFVGVMISPFSINDTEYSKLCENEIAKTSFAKTVFNKIIYLSANFYPNNISKKMFINLLSLLKTEATKIRNNLIIAGYSSIEE